jgi:hypothetical protein
MSNTDDSRGERVGIEAKLLLGRRFRTRLFVSAEEKEEGEFEEKRIDCQVAVMNTESDLFCYDY